MSVLIRTSLLSLALAVPLLLFGQPQTNAPVQDEGLADLHSASQRIFALANQTRVQAGVGRLIWDPALAMAALEHCRRMVEEGQISHRYGGEADLTTRTADAGAHFSVIEENIAVGPSADEIHNEWMNSPGHRSNLLSPDVDHVGVAVVASRGVLYAVADYSQAVPTLSLAQVEARVAVLIRASGVTVLGDPTLARGACAEDTGVPRSAAGPQPRFVLRWQDSELTHLPEALVNQLSSGNYRQASIGSCPALNVEGSFTSYRVAVLLY